ncbi:MAG TPA: class III poly(R)-hydroxyalkanoic acid synthase subunit PhaE [Xanthomonadaceae bacterium]|nr:class III poly(R)-hydroxyalkanoic acid synthase subunit PhaE [Xanthomonadaceae bacterium]
MSDHARDDFETLARRYWQAWGDTLRQGAATGQGMPGWNEAMQWWGALAPAAAQAPPATPAQPWLDLVQQLAGRFAGRDASAADIAGEWRRMLGANPMPDMLRTLRLQGMQGLDAWFEATAPWLEAWQREAGSWLRLPAFGIAREHQERWQRLAQAQLDARAREDAFNRLLLRAGERAYAIFEQKLEAHAQPGKQLGTARALFDLWIDACEEAYAETALSADFREAWAALVNAQMRVRAGVQKEVEFAGGLFGMPTRTEVDAAHRRIAELERAVRGLRDALGAQRGADGQDRPDPAKPAAGGAAPARKAAKKPAQRPAAGARAKPARGTPRGGAAR